MAKTRAQEALEKVNKKYGITGDVQTYNNGKGKQSNNSASSTPNNEQTKTKAQVTLEKINKKYGISGTYTPTKQDKETVTTPTKPTSKFANSTLNKTTDYYTELGKATDYYKGLHNTTTIASDLSEDERKKRIEEIKYELSELSKARSGLERAKMYGGVGDAIASNEARQAELKKELLELERVGTVSGADMLQWEIEDAEKRVQETAEKVQSYGPRPSEAVAVEWNNAYSEHLKAQQELEALKEKQKIHELGNVVHTETGGKFHDFFSQFGANYRLTDISEKAGVAMSDYMSNPTEENLQRALSWYAVYDEYMQNNADVLDDKGQVAPLFSDNWASQIAQMKGQAGWSLALGAPLAALGAYVGGGAGAKTGWTTGASIGAGIHSYQVIRGSLFNELISYGMDEETAYEYANDDATIEALIESGETAKDWAFMLFTGGTGKVLEGTAKTATKYATKPLLKFGADVGKGKLLNAGTEYLEEGLQGAVSRATREKALSTIDNEIGQYGKGNIDLHNRPIYKNADGSISTVDSITVQVDDKFILLPSIVKGENGEAIRLENTEDIIAHCEKTGEYLGVFDTLEEANIYANRLHSAQAYRYNENTTVDADDNILIGSGKVLADAIFGGNKEARTELHEQGKEGFKTGLVSGGIQGTANYVLSSFALARTDKQRNQIADVVLQDNEALNALIEEGKASGEGTVSAEIATEIETTIESGKEVTREQVKKLIASNEVYIQEEQRIAEQDTKAVSGVRNARNRETPLNRQLEEQSKAKAPLDIEKVKAASGFGDNGAKLLTEIASQDGMTFQKASDKMKIAYLSGYNGESVTFTDDLQSRAKLAGIDDRLADNKIAQENAKNATIYNGAFTENEHTKNLSRNSKTMISIVAKGLGIDIGTVDKIIASTTIVDGVEIPHEANAQHTDGKMTLSEKIISDDKKATQKIITRMLLHEGGHRMNQLAPQEFGVLMDALYQKAVSRGLKSGASQSAVFDYVKSEHDNAGLSMNTRGYVEEIGVRELEGIFSSPREFNKWYAEISGNEDVRTAFEKFMDFVIDAIENIKKVLKTATMTKEQRAEYRQTLAEFEHIKELYANALKAAENVVTERRQSDAQSNQNLESKANEGYTNSVNYALKDFVDEGYSTEGTKWAVTNGLLTKNEQAKFWETIADLSKRGYYIPKSRDGQYIVDVGRKLIFTNGDFKTATINGIIEFNNGYEDNIQEFKEWIIDEERNTAQHGESIQIIEIVQGEGYVSEHFPSAYRDYARKNGRGKRKNSTKTNRGSQKNVGGNSSTNFSLKGTDTTPKAVKNSSEEKITLNMHDDARVEVLNKKSVNVVSFDAKKTKTLENVDVETLQNSYAGYAGPIIKRLVGEFGILNTPFYNADIELEFNYSGDSVRESINKQHSRYGDFVKMLSVFPEVVRNAVGVEIHKDKYIGTIREDSNLNQMYVLASAFSDEKGIHPVKLEVKEFKNITNKLYLSVVLTKKRSRHLGGNLGQNQLNTTPPTSNVSIADLVSIVNPSEGDFLKYFPDIMLDSEQIEGKNIALAKDAKKIEELSRNNSLKGSVSATELFDTVDDARKGKKKAVNKLAEFVESGAMSTELYDALIGEYGTIPSGEKPHRNVQVPRKTSQDKKVSQTVRTILEAKATPDEAVPTIEKLVEDGTFSYDVYTDKQAINDAESYIKEYGWDESLDDWFDAVEKGEVSKQVTTMGWALYNNAANLVATATSETERSSAIKTSLNILDAMVRHQRSAAQALQATRILKKLSPETQLYGIQKSVRAFQNELIKKYGKRAPNLKIDEGLAGQFLNAKTEEERYDAEIEIFRDIGRQIPAFFSDKWNGWRYLGMLFNLRTHGRNIGGNAGFAPIVLTKNLTATAIESAVYHLGGKKMLRGKALVWGSKSDRVLLKAAWNDYANVAELISNDGKYNDFAMANRHIEEGRQIFKFRPLEWSIKKNSDLLEKEDMWFSKPHYAYALAQYCKANNITAEQIKRGKAIAPARNYAIKEAQKATYRDTNAFSQMVSEWGRSNKNEKNVVKKAFNTAIEGILPFRKTPANILVRGIEYSPLGLLKSLSYDLVQVSKGEMMATEAIDNISAGLTGTGLLALGVYLAAQGLVRGHGEDDEEKEFKELMGHQAYSLELPNGQSITLDWLAPEALPLFVGVNIWEATKGFDEEVNFSTILKVVSNITEPMLEMSCLQSLNDLFEGIGYATSKGTSGLMAVLSSAATSYLTQAIPTFWGQVERTGEKNRMTTYTEKNDFLTGDMQYTLGKISSKIPFWDYQQIPYIDAWGRKEASGNALKRGFNNFLNPAYTSTIETSKMEEELLRLYDKTGESGVFPSRAGKYFTVDGVRKDLTADEYVRYATLKGEKSYKLVSELVKSKTYKKLSDKEKADAVMEAYDYADQKAKQAISNYKPDTWVTKADDFGTDVGNYISFRTEVGSTKENNDDKISKSEVVDIILDVAQNDSETWKMYLSMYDSQGDMYAYNKGIRGEDYMDFLVALNKYDRPTESGKYGTYTQEEAEFALDSMSIPREQKAILWQSVNTTWKAKNNPYR